MSRPRSAAAAWLAAAWSLCGWAFAPAPAPADEGELPFVRVEVAAEAVADVPLTLGRYVPMPLEEFEEAVARLGPLGRRVRVGMAAEARYDLRVAATGELSGTVEFRVGDAAVGLPGHVPLGRLTAGRSSVRTADGSGEAAVFCLPDGTVAVRTPGPGTYACPISLPGPAGDSLLRLPLVPALVTTVDLGLPDAARPIVTGPADSATVIEPSPEAPNRWRILRGPVGPGSDLTLVLEDGRRGPTAVRAWNSLTIRGRQAEVVTRLQPMTGWMPGPLELDATAPLQITFVRSLPDGTPVPWIWQDGRLVIDVPPRLAASTRDILVGGVSEVTPANLAVLPVLEPAVARWAGCNTRLAVEPGLALSRVSLEGCRAVPPALAAGWPLPEAELPAAAAGIEPALVWFEHETPGAAARVAIEPRAASLDTARVTTVDILPGTVLGRSAADIRVVAGQVFGVTADLAPGWFIDSVELVDWATGREPGGSPGPPPEWRIVRSPRGSELRVGLPLAATPRRGLGLLINGHRSGLPLGPEFSSDDLDMLRFPGETALLEFQLGPTVVLEAVGGSLGLEPVPPRLEPLVGLAAPRARIPAGERAPAARARLVRRRPPVEAEVAVDLFARDERLAETFTFTCRPVAGELDAVVVHFSQPMPGLEWSLALGDSGSLAAQRLDRDDATRGELRGERLVAESWLVELRPATAAAVTFRAARTVPLAEAVPAPLAWVEAAERPGGLVTVRGEPGRRPTVVNHQLRELPPSVDGNPGVITLAYGPPGGLDGDAPVADVAGPPATAEPRAWAWRQVTTCRCFESGAFEWESSFDIENQGDESATITLPEGLRVEGVTVAGEAVAAAPLGPEQLGLAVPLPQATDRLTLIVRGSGRRAAGLGWWPMGGMACGIDMPVLAPETILMLPSGLELVAAEATDPRPWVTRLFGGSVEPAAPGDSGRAGFRAVSLSDATAGSPVVIRKDLVRSLAIILGFAGAIGALALAGRSGSLAVAACGAAACLALWCPSPWDSLARGMLWGGIAGTWAAGWPPAAAARVASLVAIAAGLAAGPAAAAEPEPVRVYVTPDDGGGTALVPERLFRRLSAAAAAVGPPTLRVLSSDVVADAERGSWRIGLELDADQGGSLVLDQRATRAVWRPPADTPPGLAVTLEAEGMIARLTAAAAGRQTLVLELEPVVERIGDILSAAIALPPAPRAGLRLVEGDGVAAVWQCDRSAATGPWLPAAAADGSFDISAAARVRLVRAAEPRATVLSTLRAAVSFNDIAWQEDGCLLTATYDVGGDRQIVRSLVVRADPALHPVAVGAGGLIPQPLGGGRHLIELPEPRAGQRRVVVAFRRPLADPVGIFDAPFAWLAAAETDVRTVRLRPASDLEIAPDLPAGITLVKPRDEDGLATTAVWRSDAVGPTADIRPGAEPRARIVVRRRDPQPAAVQDLSVEFAEDHVGLRLRCRLDTDEEPLLEVPLVVPPAAIIDGIALTREPPAEAAPRPPQRMDITWSREAADRIVAVVQRPETGRFRLELDARLPIRPARRGRLPIARIAADDLPLELACRTAAGLDFRVELPAADGFAPGRVELAAGASAPAYRLTTTSPAAADADERADDPPGAVAGERPVATIVDLAIDGRGRAWGLVRFDLVAVEPVVRLVLPAGLRLFDVRADGRQVTATPAKGNAWDVRLHDVAWPRSLVAVIAGTLGGRLADGSAIRLDPPRLGGLPAGQVLWAVDTPAGFAVRVSEPAAVLEPAAFAAVRGEVREGLDLVFRDAIRSVDRAERESLEGFAAARRAGGGPVGERSWYEASRGGSADPPNRTLILAGGDGSVTIRAERLRAAGVAFRGMATTAVLGMVVLAWLAVRRAPELAGRTAAVIRRWWWLGCGGIWLMTLQPAWPGLAMLGFGVWAAWRSAAGKPPAAEPDTAGPDSTLTFAAE